MKPAVTGAAYGAAVSLAALGLVAGALGLNADALGPPATALGLIAAALTLSAAHARTVKEGDAGRPARPSSGCRCVPTKQGII